MKMRAHSWFYLIFKQERITIIPCTLVNTEPPRNVTRIITPSAERELEVQLIPIKI